MDFISKDSIQLIKTDFTKAKDGHWFDMDENGDIRIKLAYISKTKFHLAVDKASVKARANKGGSKAELTPAELADITTEVYLKTKVVDWDFSIDGNEIPFDFELLRDNYENNKEFMQFIDSRVNNTDKFISESRDETVKKSVPTSNGKKKAS